MRPATMNLNRQVIRLCKGILKAWEQWVEDVGHEEVGDHARNTCKSPKDKEESNHMTIRM
ncbi:MAG: hypothetical protein OEZ57_02745 [Nitrospirota bacterium]|nr:hypothetical protein [Nitrospirota bacterium]MDH5773819.1 hypothetical protein [Nitrospirota bacterium]